MIDYFFSSHKESRGETDYLLGFILETESGFEKEIFKISDGLVSQPIKNSYLGDNGAFSSFQKAFHEDLSCAELPKFEITSLGKNETPKKFHSTLSKAIKAFDYVIHDTSEITGSVGGIRTLVISIEDQFQYLNLSGGVLRRVWLITFARGKVTNI